ncbi:MAG: FAD:protein FMN transferase [Micropepsaceae bacterium]
MNRILIPAVETPPVLPYGGRTTLAGRTMGTTWSVQAFLPAALSFDAADTIIDGALAAVIGEMSQWEPDSFLSRFNAARAGAWLEAPQHFRRVLLEALRIADLSGGAFDPALGGFTELWGFGASQPSPDAPSALALAGARGSATWREIAIEGARVYQPGLTLDFSGIAKGYAADLVAAALQAHGVPSALVEIGGELKGWGVKEDGAPWWVELESSPDMAAEPLTIALHQAAIATSGDYRRARFLGGRRVSHTLDPRSGLPLDEAPAAASVVHASCMTADALATALMVMGAARGVSFAATHGIAARVVTRDPRQAAERLSPALASMLG